MSKSARNAGKLIHTPWFVLASFVAASALLMQVGSIANIAIVVGGRVVILAASIVVVFRMFKSGGSKRGGYGQVAVMSDRLRRWVLDERDQAHQFQFLNYVSGTCLSVNEGGGSDTPRLELSSRADSKSQRFPMHTQTEYF